MCSGTSGRVSSSSSTSSNRRINLVTNSVISHAWEKDREVLATSGTYLWSFVTQIFHNGPPSHGRNRKTFKRMTWISIFLVSSNPLSRKSQALEYRIIWEIYTPYAGAAGMLLHINKNIPNKLSYISTLLLSSLGRYLCWWTSSLRGYHPSIGQCLGTDMVY